MAMLVLPSVWEGEIIAFDINDIVVVYPSLGGGSDIETRNNSENAIKVACSVADVMKAIGECGVVVRDFSSLSRVRSVSVKKEKSDFVSNLIAAIERSIAQGSASDESTASSVGADNAPDGTLAHEIEANVQRANTVRAALQAVGIESEVHIYAPSVETAELLKQGLAKWGVSGVTVKVRDYGDASPDEPQQETVQAAE